MNQSDSKWLHDFVEDAYVLARFHVSEPTGWLRGRLWEKWASRSLRGRTWRHQGPGHLGILGRGAASGMQHEIDAAGRRAEGVVFLEAKSYTVGSPRKGDLCIFDRKTFDLYLERCRRGEKGPHWRILLSSSVLDNSLRTYCYLYGIIAVDPGEVPLPILLALAEKPCADEFFSPTLLSELVRLGERAVAPMEQRYVPESHFLRFDIDMLRGCELEDLLWVQSAMSEEFLDILDRERPGYYEVLAESLMERIGLRSSWPEPLVLEVA